MAIKSIYQDCDRHKLTELGFEFELSEWVQAIINSDLVETNRYEAIFDCENGDQLSVVFYFDEDSTTLIGVDEVVYDIERKGIAYKLETTPAWDRIREALADGLVQV